MPEPAPDSAPLVELDEVTKVYGGGMLSKDATVALDGVSLTVQGDTPQIVSVVGESGSGKTTLASLLMGFIQPTSGIVRFQGSDVSRLRGALTVPIQKFRIARSKAERQELMVSALETVGLRPDETLGRYPHQLSGGQRQRIIVARALMLRPKLIVADEPVSMVDASLRATILESLRTVNRTLNVPILYITHDLGTAYHVSDHILVMYRGTVVEAGDVETVITSPKHPYTQLPIDSIPWPNPKVRWGQREVGRKTGVEGPERHEGCRFADRCPSAMPRCVETAPPAYLPTPRHAASCYLYADTPELDGRDISRLLELS